MMQISQVLQLDNQGRTIDREKTHLTFKRSNWVFVWFCGMNWMWTDPNRHWDSHYIFVLFVIIYLSRNDSTILTRHSLHVHEYISEASRILFMVVRTEHLFMITLFSYKSTNGNPTILCKKWIRSYAFGHHIKNWSI